MDSNQNTVNDPDAPPHLGKDNGNENRNESLHSGSNEGHETNAPNDLDTQDSQQGREVLGKRKRDNGEHDEEGRPQTSLFIPDENDMVPESGVIIEDDDDAMQDSSVRTDIYESDEDMVDDNGPAIAYDFSSEAFPKCAIYDKGLAQITADLKNVPVKVSRLLEQHDCTSGHVEIQRKAAQCLLVIPPTAKLRIALLGDAGAGKSSVLNSVTDIPDLAKSLSGGQSCTCVATEYSGAFPRQQKDFAAKIFYFNIVEIRRLLEELLEDYNVFAFEADDDWDEETLTAFKRKMLNAQRTFTTLFCDLPEFRDQRAAKETLRRAYEGECTTVLATMVESAERLLKTKITEQGYTEYREAATRMRLRDVLDPLITSKTNSVQPALWPLVKLVRIGVRGSRVLENITIVDLPGVSDTNETRVNLTKQHVKTCHHLWVVANISRVIDDGMVDHLLSKYGKIFKGQVAVVCTHSDDGMDSKLVRHLHDHGQDVSECRQLSEQFKTQKTAVTKVKADIERRRKRKSNTKQHLLDIQTDENDLKKMLCGMATLENSKFGSIIRARNHFVATQLKNEMEFHLPEGTVLRVFCVSNPHYAAAKGLASIRGPKLDGNFTGIPALRSFALTLPASKMLQTIDDYSRDKMLVFIKDLALWANQTTVERRQDLMELVKQPLQKLAERMATREERFRHQLGIIFSLPMREQQSVAIEAALKVHTQKNRKHPSTVRAFIRKNGLHSTKLCPKECWNEQFSKVSTDFVTLHWPELETMLEETDTMLEEECTGDLQTVMTKLRAHPFASMLPIDRLADLVDAHMKSISNVFRDYSQTYEQDMRNIQLDVTQHSDKNYFSRSIQPVYDECNDDRGQGVTQRSMNRLKAHLGKTSAQSPFAIMEKRTTAALIKNDAKHVASLQEAIRDIFQRAFDSFDRTIDRKIDDPTEKPVRERIKRALPEINEEYANACARLNEVEAKYDA